MIQRQTRFRHTKLDSIACVIALGLAGAVCGVGVWPALHAEERARHLAEQAKLSNTQLTQTQGEFRQVQQLIARTRGQLKALAVVLDAPDQLATRQASLGRLFGEVGVSVGQLSVGTIERGELVDVIPLRLTGKGSFPEVVASMHAVRSEFPDMAVTTFQISGAGGTGGTDRDAVGFSFGLAWYVVGAGEE